MKNVVLKKMRDASGAPISTDWEGGGVAPVARDDFILFEPGHKIDLRDLIANDTDPDAVVNNPGNEAPINKLYLITAGQPQHGYLSHSSKSIRYRPPEGFTGVDAFPYRVSDITGKDAWAIMYLYVGVDPETTTVDRVPIAQDDTFTVTRGESAMLDVVANDSDPEGRPLSVANIGFPDYDTDIGRPHFGSVEIVGGKIRYTANEYFTGTDRFVYHAMDEAENKTRRGTVTVNVVERR
jgi:hypothetical protein